MDDEESSKEKEKDRKKTNENLWNRQSCEDRRRRTTKNMNMKKTFIKDVSLDELSADIEHMMTFFLVK